VNRLIAVAVFAALAAVPALAQEGRYAKWSALLDEMTIRRSSLISASVLYDGTKWTAREYMVPTVKEDVKKFLDDLAEVERLMSGPYAGVEAPPAYSDRDVMEHPEVWLTLAKARNEILAKVKGKTDGDRAVAEVKFIKGITEAITTHDGWGLTENGLNIVLGKREEARQKLCGGQKFDGWDQACDELVARARKMAPSVRSYANHSMSFVTDLIKNGWSKNYKDRKILKIATAKSDWTVVKDSLGRPKYRSVGVAVRYTVSGFDLVIEQTVSILQDYVGGTYKYRPTAQVPDYRIVAK